MSVGMVNAYAGIWFDSIGLTTFQIGLLGSIPMLGLLLVTTSIGRLSDRADDWKQAIVIGSAVSSLAALGLFLSTAFWWVLAVWTLTSLAQRAMVPVSDAAALRLARREGLDFGRLRALSTIGYLLVILGAGLLLDGGGLGWFLPLFAGFGLLRMGAALRLPRMRAADALPSRARLTGHLRPAFLLPLLAWALVDATHIILNSFQGLLWVRYGIPTGLVGPLIALGALAETLLFWRFRDIAARVSPLWLIGAAGAAAVVRYGAMALEPGVAVLVLLQLMHALTYAMGFLATANFIADRVPEENAAEAQSLLVMLELVIATAAVAGFGWLAGHWGSGAYLGSAALGAAGLICVLAAARRQSP